MSLNQVVGAFKAFTFNPPAPPKAPQADAPAPKRMALDHLELRGAAVANAGLRGAIAGLTRAVARQQMALDGLTAEVGGNVSQKRMAEIQLEIANGRRQLADLQNLLNVAREGEANPKLKSADAERLAGLVKEATGDVSNGRAALIRYEAEFIVRTARHGGPTDRDYALHNAGMGVVQRIGEINDRVAAITREAASGVSQKALVELTLQLEDLRRERETLGTIKKTADRLANAPQALPDALQDRFKALLVEAQGTHSAQRLGAIATELKALARQAEQGTPEDPALLNAARRLEGRLGELTDRARALSAEGMAGVPMKRLVQLQIELDDLARSRELLKGLAAQADRLADDPRASRADQARMSALLAEASGNVTPSRLASILAAASQIGR